MELDNPYIELGLWTTLRVTATGDISPPQFKESQELALAAIGSSTSYSNINGQTTRSKTYLYRVIPNKKGEIPIPIFYSTDSKGKRVESNPLTIFVDTASSTNTSSPQSFTQKNSSDYVVLKISDIDRNLYIGEAFEFEITGYFNQQNGHSITKTPYISSGNFALEVDDKPIQRTDVQLNGQYWIEAKWRGFLTPISAGKEKLEVSIESDVSIPSRSNSFFSSSSSKSIKSSTEVVNIIVENLPEKNKPNDFTGAIGDFSISSEIDSTTLNIGDPLTLKINVFGKGNFPRIKEPKTSVDNNWKFYPPSSKFTGNNGSKFMGVKTFENVLSPNSSDVTTTPSYTFNYFDPISKRYISVKTESYNLNITAVSDNSTIEGEEEIEYKNSGTRFFPNSSNPVKSELSLLNRTIKPIIIVAAIFILAALIIMVLLKLKIIKTMTRRFKSRLDLGELDRVESSKEYNKAIELIYSILLKEKLPDVQNYNSLVSEDLKEHPNLFLLSKEIERIKYSSSSISKTDYFTLKESVLKESV